MKILIFSNIPSPYFVEYLNELGKYADVIAVFERKKASDRDKSWETVNAINFKCYYLSGINIGTESSLSFGIKKYIKENKDRIIIFGNPTTLTGIIGIKYCKRHNIQYCLQSEGGFANVGNNFKTKLKRYLFKDASLCLTGMEPSTDYFSYYGVPVERIKQYPFSSLYKKDLLKEPVSKNEKDLLKKELNISYSKMVLYVGRMIDRKGVDVLLKAFKNINDDVCLYCVGGEPTKEYLEIIEECKIKNIVFLKHFSDIEVLKKYYKAADLFVLPTRGDTWGLVINEAMSFGLPVITTKSCIAGLQLVKNDENGYLVDADSIDQLRDTIKMALEKSEALNMSTNNLEKIKNYTYENMAVTIFKHLTELEKNK